MANPFSCLICNSDLDQSSLLTSSNDERNTQFKLGLQLFCNLLKIGGNYVDKIFFGGGGESGHGDVVGPPCCKECWLAFEQMLRLQQAIELIQVSLKEQVDKLKKSLRKSVPSDYKEDPLKLPVDDSLGEIRDQLLSCVRNSSTPPPTSASDHQPYKKRRYPLSKSAKQPDSVILKKGKEYQHCSVILERLSDNQSTIIPKIEPEEEESKANITPSSDLNDDGQGQTRKSKLKAFEFIRESSSPQTADSNDEDYLPSPGSPPSPIEDNLDDDKDDDQDEDEYPWESEAEPIPESLPRQLNGNGKCGIVRKSKFSLITPNTLLYNYTLIKVSQGYTHFTCQEPDCPSPNFSDSSLNWNSLFNQVAHHIIKDHSVVSLKNKVEMKCPLCPIILPRGSKFRYHLTGIGRNHDGHRIETVICEICWRPIRNLADAYKCHLWQHKNDKEKGECPEGPPLTILAKAKTSKKLKRKLEKIFGKKGRPLKMKKEKPEVKKKKPEVKPPKPNKQVVKVKLKPVPKRKPTDEPIRQRGCNTVGDHFSPILEKSPREYFLIYKFTLLKALYGISLTCQDVNCDFIINGTDFTAFEQFKDHVKTYHSPATRKSNIGQWKCPLCSEALMTCFDFRRHFFKSCHSAVTSASVATSNNLRYICTVCWKPFNSGATLEYHQWCHKSEDEKMSMTSPPTLVKTKEKEMQSQLKCRHCQRKFNLLMSLKAHEATHVPKEERKKYGCPQCPRQFLSAVAVRGHVEREHQRELMRIRTCPICGKEYNWRNGYKFRTHLKSHKDERNWICDTCGRGFYDSQGLQKHKARVHEGMGDDRPWQCEFCEMNYKDKNHLQRHRRNQHKEKVGEEEMEETKKTCNFTRPEFRSDFIGPRIAFPCPGCEKVFQLRSRMKKHWEKGCKSKKF